MIVVTRPIGFTANTVSKSGECVRNVSKIGYENEVLARPPAAVRAQLPHDEFMISRGPDTHEKSARRSGSCTGIGFHTAASSRLKIAVFAPMPSASDRIATALNAGARRSWRYA